MAIRAHDPMATGPRGHGRKGAKAARHQNAPRVKVHLSLGARAHELLGVHAHLSRRSMGDLVTELVEAHLTRYQVRDLGGPSRAEPEGAAGDDEARAGVA